MIFSCIRRGKDEDIEMFEHYSLRQNRIGERNNRTPNSLLLSSGAPQNLWGEVVECHKQIMP